MTKGNFHAVIAAGGHLSRWHWLAPRLAATPEPEKHEERDFKPSCHRPRFWRTTGRTISICQSCRESSCHDTVVPLVPVRFSIESCGARSPLSAASSQQRQHQSQNLKSGSPFTSSASVETLTSCHALASDSRFCSARPAY